MIIDNKSQLNTNDDFDIVTCIYVSMYQFYQCYICHQVSCVSKAMQALLDSLEEREAEVVALRKGKEEVLKDMRAENRNGPVFRNLQ